MRSATRSFDPVHRGGDTRRLADLLQHGAVVGDLPGHAALVAEPPLAATNLLVQPQALRKSRVPEPLGVGFGDQRLIEIEDDGAHRRLDRCGIGLKTIL